MPRRPRSSLESAPWRASLALVGLAAVLALGACQQKQKTIVIRPPESIREYHSEGLREGHEIAARAFETDDPIRAMQGYQEALSRYREIPAAWNNLGVLLMEADYYLEAQEAFSQATQLAPTEPRPLYNLGLLYDRRGYIREARRYYAQALDRDSAYLPALRAAIRADSILREGDDQTLEWLSKAVLLEQDAKWRDWMRLQRVRIENRMADEDNG